VGRAVIVTGMERGAREAFRVPTDPAWTLIEDGLTPVREHEIESLFTVANGYSGTRGALVVQGTPLSSPATFLAGVFDRRRPDDIPEFAVGPDWTGLRLFVEGYALRLDEGEPVTYRRVLDLRHGVLWREWLHQDLNGRRTRIVGFRLASLAERHLLFQSILIVPENYTGRLRLEARIEPPPRHLPSPARGPLELVPPEADAERASPLAGRGSPLVLTFCTRHTDILAAFAAHSSVHRVAPATYRAEIQPGRAVERWEAEVVMGEGLRLDRLVAVETSRDTDSPAEAALHRLQAWVGRDAELLEAHARAWLERWADADIEVEGDEAAQRVLRFALYHLVAAANPEDERVSVGARGLTGVGYKGHVFWDTETFMLPFYSLAYPAAARAMLMYRYHTLNAARQKAASGGYRGALYAWESADSGEEVTPTSVVGPLGEVIPILTGQLEHHISADVAYAVWQYWEATGDDEFLRVAGAEILLETARFWASRGTAGPDGRWHIRQVIGPDEYHEGVDDNAYTNLLAQWNLTAAAEAAGLLAERWPEDWQRLRSRLALAPREPEEWRTIARAMYTGLDPRSGLFEQFAGYFALEPIDLTAYAGQNMPLDLLLGREKVQGSQIVKQADVVMAVYLLWDRLAPEVRAANFRHYEPRTAHGSSLSPAIHAAVAARLGDLGLAWRYFWQTAEIDLANNMGNASHGVHMAALGGLWQAAVMGFGGIRPSAHGLVVEPHLPPKWHALRCRLRWRGRRVTVGIRQAPRRVEVAVDGSGSVPVRVGAAPPAAVQAGRPRTFEWGGDPGGH